MDDDATVPAFPPALLAEFDRSADDARAGRTVSLATVLADLDRSIARTQARVAAEPEHSAPSL